MRYYLNLIREHGIVNCLKRVVGNVIYCVVAPLYKKHILKTSKIDENKILFCSKPAFSDNAKALYDYLKTLELEDKLKFVWLVDESFVLPENIEEHTEFVRDYVLWHSGMTLKGLKELATSKYVFFTHNSPIKELKQKRNGQVVINLWHGCGYKDIKKSAVSWVEKNPFDYALVPGNVFIKTKSKFWGCEEEKIIPIGYPRYDLLKKECDGAKKFAETIKGEAEKLVVWMPTFRKTAKGQFPEAKIKGYFELPLLASEEQLDDFNQVCKKKKVVVCVKRHPSQLKYECEKKSYSNIKFISNDDLVREGVELYSFLRYTDALISDYSSVAIDYILLDKPMAFSLDDFKDYKDTRGFVFEDPLKYMPGNHLYDYQDMKMFIDEVCKNMDSYKKNRDSIILEVHNPCENYCKRVWDVIRKEKADV